MSDQTDTAAIDDSELRDIVFGWRMWLSDGTGLFPPTACRDHKVTDRMAGGWCPNPEHQPPVPGCTCGIYALENLVDALYRFRVTQYNLRTRTTSAIHYGRQKPDVVPVLTRVAIFGARLLDRMPDGRLFIAPELRAATVCMEQLFVSGADDACPHFLTGCPWLCRYCPDAERIAETLGAELGLHSIVGLPSYTCHDWETRSDWCKQLGPQGVPDPDDDVYISWFLEDEPVVAFTATVPNPGETVAGEAICREILDTPGRKNVGRQKPPTLSVH